MSYNSDFPNNNVVPIRKTDRFGVYLGEVTSSGEIIEGESVGIAFLKIGSKKFKLKIFVYPGQQYFVVPDDKDDTKYVVLSLEEYKMASDEIRTNWNRIGEGRLVGCFISLRIQLFTENIFICLFPDKKEALEDMIAS
ncbi:MAG: hypothetical protein B7Y39_01910 [Bdellovibrio sp. 28-41-41]|nr:MAG: hypothetical protein B7Y39_01910 [Bdellovibrio sp. 28-41-41]